MALTPLVSATIFNWSNLSLPVCGSGFIIILLSYTKPFVGSKYRYTDPILLDPAFCNRFSAPISILDKVIFIRSNCKGVLKVTSRLSIKSSLLTRIL